MKAQDFCYWLHGFFEISENKQLTTEQVEVIQEHLDLVFTKVTEKSVTEKDELKEIVDKYRKSILEEFRKDIYPPYKPFIHPYKMFEWQRPETTCKPMTPAVCTTSDTLSIKQPGPARKGSILTDLNIDVSKVALC